MTAMPRPSKSRRSGISFHILALEPRMMFDGAAAGDVADKAAAASKSADTATAAAAATTTTDTSAKSAAAAAEADKSAATATVVRWNGQVSTDTTGTRHEVVVVDTTVADWQTLVAGINPNTPIILLKPNANGMGELEVLAQIMSQYHDLDAIHLVAEGRTGAILLGKEVIWNGDMTAASPYLATIGGALKDGGDFMLYSCSVAGSDSGKAFIDSFARALGKVDVAASTDRTGPTRLGGDWDLEYKVGDIETVLPFTLQGMQDISHCLGCSVTGTNGSEVRRDSDNTLLAHYDSSAQDWRFDFAVHLVDTPTMAVAVGDLLNGNWYIGPNISSDGPFVLSNIVECQTPANTAPTVTAGSSSASYTENGSPVTVDNTITVADAEQADITGATAIISGNFVTGDVLNFTAQNGITGSWDAGTHTLTLSGTATKAQYQAALRSITFSSSSDAPTNATRTITWKVNDGQSSNNLSTGVTSSVSVTPVNDTPTGTPSVSGTTQVGQTLTGSAASVADLDGLGTFSYQWQSSSDGSTWNNISGATSTTYSLQSAENGKHVRLKVSYTDGGGTAETVYSTATAAVTAPPSTTVSVSSLSADTGSSGTDWITKTAAQTVSGTLSAALVAGETVQVSFDNGSTWQNTTATAGDSTFSFITTLSGTNTFKARVTNSTGSSTAFSHSYTLDTTAPSAPTVSISADTGSNASDGVTKTATQTVTVTAEGSATLDIDYGDGTAHGSANGSHTYTADGKYTISVTATDAAGNVSSAGTKVIVVDTTAPTNITPSVTQVAVDDATNGATFCALTATDATNIPSFTDAWTYTLGGTDAGKFSISGGNLVINNSGGLTTGSYSVDVTATDTAGNTYTKTLTLSVVSGPSTAVSTASLSADTGSSNTDWITKTAAQTVSGTLSAALVAGETVQVSFDNGSTWQNTSATTGDTTFNFTTTLSGANTFKARVTDSIGSSTAFSHSYALDTTIAAPSAPDLSAASDSGRSSTDNVTNVTTPTFTGTAEAGATVTLYDTDGTTVLGTTTADATTGAWSITSSALSDGSHTVTAKAVDVAGNVSVVSSGLAVTIDSSAPAAPSAPDLTTASDSGENSTDNITTNTTPTFTGTAEAGATVTLYDTNGTTVLGTTTADATTGAWSITSSTLGLGDHTITAKTTDAAGNVGSASSGLTMTIVTGPAAPTGLAISSDTGQSNSDNITKIATQTISGSGPAGATILIYKNGVQVGSVTADASTGSWTYNTGALADGTYAFTAKARVSGQDSAASTALNVTVDTATPTAPHVTGISTDDGSSTSDGVTTDRTLTISGTAEAGSKVEVFKNGVSLGIVDADPTTGSWSFDYTGTVLADGSYVFTATATDNAGNTSATSSGFTAKVTTDATAPGAPTLTATGGGTTTAFSATGTAEAGATVKIYDGATLLGTATADGTGAWSYTGTLAVGTHTLTATATDAADNISVASGSATITVTSPPTPQPPAPTTTPTDQGTPKETKASDTTPVPSAPPVTTVREPTVTDKPVDMQTVVRTTSITTPSGFGDAGTGTGVATGAAAGTGGLGGGTTGGFSGGVPVLGDTSRTAGGGNTFQVAVAARAPGGGDALVVNTRVPDASFDAGSRISVTVPGDAFAHTRADATVTLSATRGDGAALPGWMNFNPRTGTFEGTPPPNFRGEVVVKVTARDSDGRQVVQTFKIVVGRDQGTVAPDRGQGQPGGRSGALPDQSGIRLGDAQPAGRTSLTEQLRQMSFKGGMARHIAMFETITRGDKVV
ncbi:Ig-like domain-containing protein [Magnetospirillum fulvum]|uniref:Autotransporter adhesin n=1 Tax=Magnetospirillum fulvum MGU-K5 TaxID=1316936 RepID=S9SB94_MAGFU|nr:Ig-like domain-containing protein [Magnetospirillum fulvum]EPY01984.1 autotransporter adhesin [Magnetospirillum fulvum MGU-K5]